MILKKAKKNSIVCHDLETHPNSKVSKIFVNKQNKKHWKIVECNIYNYNIMKWTYLLIQSN